MQALTISDLGVDFPHAVQAAKIVRQIADMFNVPRSTVYGHLDREETVPRQPKKTAAAKP